MNLKELQEFANAEKIRLEKHYNLDKNEKVRVLAHMTKVTEETGELADAILKHLKLQREEKLENHTFAKLEKEFADVIYTTVILADNLGVKLDEVMTARVKEIKAREYGA